MKATPLLAAAMLAGAIDPGVQAFAFAFG